jgi:hypothetical protein
MHRDLRERIASRRRLVFRVSDPDFSVSVYALSGEYKTLLSESALKNHPQANEFRKYCFVLDQLEKISLILSERMFRDIEKHYFSKYGTVVRDGLDSEAVRYALHEVLRNAYVHAHRFDYTRPLRVEWRIENDRLVVRVGDEKSGWTQNRFFYQTGIARFLEVASGGKKQVNDVFLEKILRAAGARAGMRIVSRTFDLRIHRLARGKTVELAYPLVELSRRFIEKTGILHRAA